jgi:prophage regulatory protein
MMGTHTTTPEFIVADEIAQRIPYSQNQLRRLEAQGSFPKRVRIGANRVAWVREEIDDWIEARMNARNGEVV